MEEKYIGYIKYNGSLVEDGLFGMRSSAQALLGFDEILRYFLTKEEPSLAEFEFEIPVRIKKGSWEALIPETIGGWIQAGGGVALTTYLTATAKKAATDGFYETGLVKDIKRTFQNAINATQWIIKITKHLGGFLKNKLENSKEINNKSTKYIEIINDQGLKLEVPKEFYNLFLNCPIKIFSKNIEIITDGRELEIGVFNNDEKSIIKITNSEKSLFIDFEEDDIILPELEHGQFVELKGEIIRATENTNTIGFRYKNHTIVCKPTYGNIAHFKNKIISNDADHFFPLVILKGKVNRKDKNGNFKEKKPDISFTEILPIQKDIKNYGLFD